MYNKRLDTFLKVAELGSFSKAAEALYITPSAVLQQINLLERELDIRLLNRTPRGAILTPAGELLCREGKKLVEHSGYIRRELSLLREREEKTIRLGVGLLHQCRVFYDLWNDFAGKNEDCRVEVQKLPENKPQNGDADLFEGIHYARELPAGLRFLELKKTPIVCALWREHPLAKKDLLRYEDMRGQTMVSVGGPGFSQRLHDLNRRAEEHGVKVLEVPRYDLSVFSMCAANGYLLQIPQIWRDIHPQLVLAPCQWDYALPYGFFYREDGSSLVKKFISFVEKRLRDPDILLKLE